MDYRKLAKKSLDETKKLKLKVNENIKYAEGHVERMDPRLERELRDRKHSLGDHPIFPQGDEKSFEQKIMADRFEEVMRNYKQKFDCETINNDDVKLTQMPLVGDCMQIEGRYKKELEELAIKMIRDEYNISADILEITAELTNEISMEGTKKEKLPTMVEVEFQDHEQIQDANDNVYKRRFLNAMTQGAAKKSSHMFHLVNKELSAMDPRLTNKYGKLMAAADYCYFVEPDMHDIKNVRVGGVGGKSVSGGVVRVTLPTEENPKCHIHAQAMVFPVLIHELVKGVMEILSAHGLPDDDDVANYVIGKADFLAAEPWDMRLGQALWERFTKLIKPKDFHLKHNVYSELAALPVGEFNRSMREVMAGTKLGQEIINELLEGCKSRIQEDDYRDEIGDDDSGGFSLNDLDNIDINDLL
jgi:hypothetical protein